MSPLVRYGIACLGIVAVGVALCALLLDRAGRNGVMVAGAVAVPVQLALFAGMSRAKPGTNAFLAAWVGGMLARMVVVGLVALVLMRRPGLPEAPTLMGLVAFFFTMVLLEPLFLGLRARVSELRSE